MRRLLLIVCAAVLVDTMLFAALTPLVPEYSRELGLSKIGAGALVASYAVGVLLGAFPAGIAASRLGPKPATLAGLLVVGGASFAFAFAGDEWALGGARFAQGIGSALSWAGGLAWLVGASPRERRGELLGTAIGAAIFGALLGPVLGGVASVAGTRAAFSGVALLAVLVVALGLSVPAAPRARPSLAALARAFAERRFVGGLWLMLLPALLFGMLAVLAPLDLDRAGWNPLAIGALFLTAAALEALLNPLVGRVADRRGRLVPVRVALPIGAAVALALGWAAEPAVIVALALLASLAWGSLFTPGTALLSDGAERARLPQGLGFGVMNAGWATGATLGPALGGALGETAGDPVAYGTGALACAATFLAVRTATARVGTLTVRVPRAP
ncbi:MAG TPA: MFS transporter [Gaiellaceae bacterium]|nr:MFS transporter [Gaiellaceae bacterium]